MKNFLIFLIPIVIVGIILIVFVLIPNSTIENELPLGMYGSIPESTVTYATSTAGTGVAIYEGPAYLERIIVGQDEVAANITLIDASTSTALITEFLKIDGDTLQGVYEIGTRLHTGIWCAASGTINTTFIYIPMGK